MTPASGTKTWLAPQIRGTLRASKPLVSAAEVFSPGRTSHASSASGSFAVPKQTLAPKAPRTARGQLLVRGRHPIRADPDRNI